MNGIPAASSLMPVSPGWHNAGPNAVRDPAADPWFCAMQQISFAMQQVRIDVDTAFGVSHYFFRTSN
jgi:hypothetical protein